MFLGNSHLPILECWDRNYFPHLSALLVHDISAMLIGTQTVSLCAYCNHFDHSQILDLKNFQGPPLTIRPLDFSFPNVKTNNPQSLSNFKTTSKVFSLQKKFENQINEMC